MAYSYVRYTGNGATTNYTFPFQYLSQDHIKVRINGVLTTLFSFLNANTVQMFSAPASGAVIEIRRETPKDTPIVNFTDGSVLLERDLDLLATFDLYLAQEASDFAADSLTLNNGGQWDARSLHLVNLPDPSGPTEPVTKGVLDYQYPAVQAVSLYTSQLNIVASDLGAPTGMSTDMGLITDATNTSPGSGTSKIVVVADNIADVQAVADNLSVIQAADENAAAAAASASAAASSASSASASAFNASSSASTALAHKNAAEAASTAAASSASSASTSAATATTQAGAAATSAANAASSANSASTSASSASSSAATATTKASEASTSAASAATSAASASTSATAASGSASSASSSASSATSSASSASTSAAAAAASEANAAAYELSANNWATKTSGPVAGGEYSAKYHAQQAVSSASSASTSATNAASSATAAASSATSAAASASDAAASAASAAALLDNFDDRYLGPKSTAPTVDNDGNALIIGALYFDSTSGKMRVFTASGWVDASSASQAALTVYKFTATAGQTTFSGASANGTTLAYLAGGLVVTLNGVVLVGGGDDYTATNGTSVVLTSGASAGDTLEVYAFSSFSVASLNGSAIVDNTITTAKYLDGSVTAEKLAGSAVTTAKLADASVTTVKIADGAVTNDKLADIDLGTLP